MNKLSNGLMLVKTDFKDFPHKLIIKNDFECQHWTKCATKNKEVKLQACWFFNCHLNAITEVAKR